MQRFLRQTGGVLGGWDDYDHNTFLHLRAKHSVSSSQHYDVYYLPHIHTRGKVLLASCPFACFSRPICTTWQLTATGLYSKYSTSHINNFSSGLFTSVPSNCLVTLALRLPKSLYLVYSASNCHINRNLFC